MLDLEQVIHDEPYRLVCGHPVLAVEALQVDRDRKNGATYRSRRRLK